MELQSSRILVNALFVDWTSSSLLFLIEEKIKKEYGSLWVQESRLSITIATSRGMLLIIATKSTSLILLSSLLSILPYKSLYGLCLTFVTSTFP